MNKTIFRVLHVIVLCTGILACAVLFHAREGHPPGIIFLPFAAAAWVFLHLFLAGIYKLGSMGEDRAYALGAEPEPWPPALILTVLGCCVILFNGMTAIAPLLVYRNHTLIVLLLFLVIQGLNLACMCGILLRRDWGRLLAGYALLTLAGLILLRMAPVLLWGSGIGFIALAYAACVIGGFSGLGYYLLSSQRIRNFFVRLD